MNYQLFVGSPDYVSLGFRVHFYFAADSGTFYYRDPWRKNVASHHGAGLKLHSFPGVDSTAHLTGNDGFLSVQVSLDHRPCGNQYLGPYSDRPFNPSLDSHHSLCLKVANNCHVAGDNGEGYLVGFPALELVALIIPGRAGEKSHQRPSLTNVKGSRDTPCCLISKCKWGAVERPLFPLRPTTSPEATVSPTVTIMRERWPYIVWYSSG